MLRLGMRKRVSSIRLPISMSHSLTSKFDFQWSSLDLCLFSSAHFHLLRYLLFWTTSLKYAWMRTNLPVSWGKTKYIFFCGVRIPQHKILPAFVWVDGFYGLVRRVSRFIIVSFSVQILSFISHSMVFVESWIRDGGKLCRKIHETAALREGIQ